MSALDLRGALVVVVALALAACSGDPVGQGAVGRTAEGDGAAAWKIVTISDFNADGLGDVLWSDPSTGRIAIYLLRGTELFEPGPEIPGPGGPAWAPITGADFDLDSMADVPWFDARSKHAAVWLMRGTHLTEPGPEIPGPHGDGWTLSYAGDFDGDGMADLIWHDPLHGTFAIWLMRGTHVVERGPELPGPEGDGWTVPTLGDFNLDGTADIVWHNADENRIAVWLMRGTHVFERGPEIHGPPGRDWIVPSAGDFDGDGIADLIWNDPTENRVAIWLMRGTSVREAGPEIPGPEGDGWSVGSAADTDGDGLSDAVWQNTRTDHFAVWRMAGTHVLAPGPAIPGPP